MDGDRRSFLERFNALFEDIKQSKSSNWVVGAAVAYTAWNAAKMITSAMKKRRLIKARVNERRIASTLPLSVQALIAQLDESESRLRDGRQLGPWSHSLPLTVVDLAAFDANVRRMIDAVTQTAAVELKRGALPAAPHGKSIRVATKSVRCIALLQCIVGAIPAGRCVGLMTFTPDETLALASDDHFTAVLGSHRAAAVHNEKENPTMPRRHSAFLIAYPIGDLSSAVTVWRAHVEAAKRGLDVGIVIDDPAHVDLLQAAARCIGVAATDFPTPLAIWLDLDMSLKPAGEAVHLGVRRSPLRCEDDVVAVATYAMEADMCNEGLATVGGLMGYEAQIAGLQDYDVVGPKSWLGSITAGFEALARTEIKERSEADCRARRGEAFAALSNVVHVAAWNRALFERNKAQGVAEVAGAGQKAGANPARSLQLLSNGGGSGSLICTSRDPNVTEVTIGSGALCGHLFDGYIDPDFTTEYEPAIFTVLRVSRAPEMNIGTCQGGGWVASGEAGESRLPLIVYPSQARYVAMEAAGEVQTPVVIPFNRRAPAPVEVGSVVVTRPAKSGELGDVFRDYGLLTLRDGALALQQVPTYRGAGLNAWN